jgi:phage terminase Nu1 subunit (DNA packaging protein)
MIAMAQSEELRLSQIKGKLLRVEDVEFVFTRIFTAIKNILLAIPSHVARLLVGKTSMTDIEAILGRRSSSR